MPDPDADDPQLSLGYSPYTDTGTNQQSILVEITNVGQIPAAEVKVDFVYEFETPQDCSHEFPGAMQAHEIGRRLGFSPKDNDRSVPAGQTRRFLFPPEWVGQVKSIVDALSPERYSINVTVNGKDTQVVPGNVFGEFVQRQLD